MSNQTRKLAKRVVAMTLAVLLVFGMLPYPAFAAATSTVTTDLSTKSVMAGEYTEFTVYTTPGDDLGKMVCGYLDLNGGDWSVVESLQYKESKDGQWYDLPQGVPFGPASGFPLADAASTFRVKFSAAGTYSYSIAITAVDSGDVLCSLQESVTVAVQPSAITTDISDKQFVVGEVAEFTFTSIPNGHANEMVFGKFDFSDWSAVASLEYWGATENAWLPLSKDVLFGPVGTGFPMTQATTSLRAVFSKPGSYNCSVALVRAADTADVLCSVQANVSVVETIAPVVESVVGNPTAWSQSATITGTCFDEGGSGVAKVVYSTDSSYANTHPEAKLTEGGFEFTVSENATYYIWAVDGCGNVSQAKEIVIDKIDTEAPALQVVADFTDWTKEDVKIHITVSDNREMAFVKYNTINDLGTAIDLSATEDPNTITVTEQYNGYYYVWAADTAGNIAESNVEIKIDKTAPSVIITTIPSATYTNEDVLVEGTVADISSGVQKVVYGTGSDPEQAVGEAILSEDKYSFSVSKNGIYNVWSVDRANNYSDVASIEIKCIDKEKPVIGTISVKKPSWGNWRFKISGTVSDDLAGVDRVLYNTTGQYGENMEQATLKKGEFELQVNQSIFGQDDDYRYYFWAVDKAGNVSEVAQTSLRVDQTSPTVRAETDAAGWTNKSVTVSGYAQDNAGGYGVDRVIYGTTNDSAAATGEAVFDARTGKYYFTVENTENVNATYYVWAIDKAYEDGGNVSEPAQVEVKIDTDKPTIKALTAEPNVWTNGAVAVSGTVEDEGGSLVNKVVYSASDSYKDSLPQAVFDAVTGTYNFTVTNDKEFNGHYYVWVVDAAGNVSDSSSVLVQIDTTKPTASIHITEEFLNSFLEFISMGLYSNTDLKVTISAEDNKSPTANSGVEKIEYYKAEGEDAKELLDKEELTALDQQNAITWIEYESFDVSEDGLFVVYAKVTDRAGNVDYFCSEQVLRDTVPPTASIWFNTDNAWDTLLTAITFGLYRADNVNVTIDAKDDSSGVDTVEYYIVEGEAANSILTEKQLASLEQTVWKTYTSSFPITDDRMAVVYVRVCDKSGNEAYFCSDGLIVEDEPADIKLILSDPAVDNKDRNDDPEEKIFGYYKDDVTVDITVEDSKPYSGIKNIEYWVTADGTETQHQILYSFGYDGSYDAGKTWEILDINQSEPEQHTGIPTQELLRSTWEGRIFVDAQANNSCNVVLTVKVTDNAGNVSTQVRHMDIDVTAPLISVSYDNNDAQNGSYFDRTRIATVVITERTHHFDASKVDIQITAEDANHVPLNDLDSAVVISGWDDEKVETDASPDMATHKAFITYSADANYEFKISYTDEAGNKNDSKIDTGDSVAPYKFTVDTNKPTGSAAIGTHVWDELLEKLTFGLYTNDSFTVTASAQDATSPLKMEYYKISGEQAPDMLSESELAEVADWTVLVDNTSDVADQHVLTVSEDEQFVVYFRLTDYAGNRSYICTDGAIVENTPPVVDKPAPQITITPEQPVNGFYNRDVGVDIHVIDPLSGDTFSGLKYISYKVFNMGKVTKEEELYLFDKENPIRDELQQEWDGHIVVDSVQNNSNDVRVEVYAEDNAGNTSSNSVSLQIDITAPQISIVYDNNSPENDTYYNTDRTATIVVTERNFDPKDVITTITNTDGVIPALSDWQVHKGTGNGDDTTSTATISYTADGDYTFAVDYTDLAGNACTQISSTSASPYAFTIDKTLPTIRVTYDNNAAQNGRYFDASRTATVTVVEHNFDVDRVNFERGVDRGGELPAVAWTHNGDTHVATIAYTVDGDYTFDVSMSDLAGNVSGETNYADSVAGNDFVIDQTFEDMIEVGGVENGAAYGHDAEVIPTMRISDINLDDYTVSLVGIQKDNVIDLTEQASALLSGGGDTVTAALDVFETRQDLDGIYTLTITSQDLAGNTDSEEIVFTVNRFGSVYTYSSYLLGLIANGGSYVQAVEENLVIDEFNADKLLANSLKIEITMDGRPLDNVQYTVTPEINDAVSVGESGWYQYRYVISKDNFVNDGIYKIAVSSKDATGNQPENTSYEGMEMAFQVDSTPAEITSIVGLENSIINASEVAVDFTVFDAIGLKSINVYVNDEPVDAITDFSADMNNYSGQFTMTEQSYAQSVRVVVEDMAGNITDTSSEDFTSAYAFYDSVTISTNLFVRWYANKPLFWGSIAGVVVVAGGLGAFFALYHKKKEEKEAAAK